MVMDIMIIEDHGPTRERLAILFEGERDYRVVASVGSAEEAMEELKSVTPDIIILDLDLPGFSGEKAIKAILALCPSVEILVFTVSDDDEKVFSSFRAGASGYILKDSRPVEITSAVEELRKGGAPMSFPIARKVLREFRNLPADNGLEGSFTALSQREEEILNLLYRGSTYREIAKRLSISTHTVHTHIKNIYQKLQTNSRSLAIYEAIRRKIIKP